MNQSLSIIIPAYNEQKCIASSLGEVLRFAAAQPGPAEVIVVDDGSSDTTAARVEEVMASLEPDAPRLRLVRHGVNRGKGASVRTGFAHAGGEIVLFTDADLSAPIEEATHLIEPVTTGECEVAIGSRAVDPSRVEIHQSLIRRSSGRIFNRMVRRITGLNIGDTQCGFKAFRRTAIAPAFAAQRLEGFAFDVELLYLASRLGLRILELPVRWRHVPDSRVSLVTDSVRMFLDICRIRLNHWRGAYGPLTKTGNCRLRIADSEPRP
jgi:dolichyl-phosphate beta-glucosyltransferase